MKLLALFSTQEFNFKISTLSVHFHERVDTKNASHARVWHFEALRKGLEPALRAETLSTLPPADSVSCPLGGGLEVEGSESCPTINEINHPKRNG